MIIYPAIDLKNGRVVRLQQGDFAHETVFADDPLIQAQEFEKSGASWLHMVDLDGAKDGESINGEIVCKIKENTGLKIQLGGGIRSLKKMEEWFEIGIDRLVMGTLALENPAIIGKAIHQFGADRIVVGIDAKDGRVATHGWVKESEYGVLAFAQKMVDHGVSQILYTDISRDGMLAGPDLFTLQKLMQIEEVQIIASGGVSSYDDLNRLKEIKVAGVIIGQALYKGVLSLSEILAKVS